MSQVISPDRDDNFISLHDANNTPFADTDCPHVFNSFFSSVFTSEHAHLPEIVERDYSFMSPIDITIEGIVNIIENLRMSSSSGIDNINSKILKNTVYVSGNILFHIFRQSLATGMLPSDWKIAKVVPVHKSGSKSSPGNYRPISLTCIYMLQDA